MDRTNNLFICFSVSETPGGRGKKMSMHYFQLDNNSVLCNNLRPNLIPYVTFRRKKNYLRNSQRDQTVTDLSFIFKLKKIINCPLNTQLYWQKIIQDQCIRFHWITDIAKCSQKCLNKNPSRSKFVFLQSNKNSKFNGKLL